MSRTDNVSDTGGSMVYISIHSGDILHDVSHCYVCSLGLDCN